MLGALAFAILLARFGFARACHVAIGESCISTTEADQSGGWQKWEASDPANKAPFLIDTDDRRVTGGPGAATGGATDGTLIKYWPNQTASPFQRTEEECYGK